MVEYIRKTTGSNLDFYFNNYVRPAKAAHMSGNINEYLKEAKKQFITGLQGVIKRNLLVGNGVTNRHLREIVQLAESGDWTDAQIIQSLYKHYNKIRK